MAVVSSCRDVGLSPATSATLTFSCHHLVGHSERTASDKLEEGGRRQVLMALRVGPMTNNGIYNRKQDGDVKQILKDTEWIAPATRVHEAGITSNRISVPR